MEIRSYTIILIFSIIFSSCSAKWANQLATHQNTLNRTASSSLPASQKLDTLLTSFAGMMHQAMDRLSPKTGVKYVESYAKANEQAILTILADVSDSAKNMSGGEKIALGLGLLSKSYVKDFKELLPRFQRKYAQYKLVSSLSNKVKIGLGDIAGSALGF